MKFKDPLDVTCPGCKQCLTRPVNWLMQPGQHCSLCGASLAPIRQSMLSGVQEWNNFVGVVEVIMTIEERFGIGLTDEDACGLTTPAAVCRFIAEAVRAKGGEPNEQTIRDGLRSIAANHLGINELTPATDLFAGLRRAPRR